MPVAVPTFVTHYYRSDRRPFLNLSDLDQDDLGKTISELGQLRDSGLSQRVFGRRYMELRRLTETRLRELFVAAGGIPKRTSPHYFVLGSSEWFRLLTPETRSIEIEISELPTEQTSITFPDSLTAMEFGPSFGLPQEHRPYHGKVFRLEELADLAEKYGLPDDEPDATYEGYEHRPFEKYVEIQLWTDEPVLEHLS